MQDVLRDAGYVRNRKDGMRYPSFVRLDEKGQRIRGDKFIVTRGGQFCFHPPVQKNYNVVSLIKEHPQFFPEYEVGMNLDKLVNKLGFDEELPVYNAYFDEESLDTLMNTWFHVEAEMVPAA